MRQLGATDRRRIAGNIERHLARGDVAEPWATLLEAIRLDLGEQEMHEAVVLARWAGMTTTWGDVEPDPRSLHEQPPSAYDDAH